MSENKQAMAVTKAEIYRELNDKDLEFKTQQMSKGSRTVWLKSFLGEHLSTNRLRKKEDDISSKYESVDCLQKRKRVRKCKSKAAVGKSNIKTRNALKCKFSSKKSFSSYVHLHELWKKYMEELMQFSSSKNISVNNLAQKILKADLHGCIITVRKSKCPGYVGISGIIIQETRNMFVLITPEDKVKRIPKAQSIFTTVLQDYAFTIYGNQFLVKPGDRAAKKFKLKPTTDL